MEVLHAIFHGALVGAHFVVAALVQGRAAGVHALADFVVLDAGFHIGRLLCFDKLTLKGRNLFWVVKLHHVHGLVHAHGEQGGDGQHVRIPLHHDVRVVGEPDGALFGRHTATVIEQGLLPAFVHRRATSGVRLAQAVGHAHGLYRVVFVHFPAQVVAGHKLPQTGVEGADVVVLQIHLNEGLPVVVAFVHLHFVEHVAAKAQVGPRAHAGQLRGDIDTACAACVFEQQSVPLLQFVVVQVQARVVGKVWRANEGAAWAAVAASMRSAVGPAVQRADDVAPGGAVVAFVIAVQGATPLEHHCLAVAAHIGDQLDATGIAHQRTAFVFLGQGVVVPHVGHAQGMPHIAGPLLEDALHLPCMERGVKVAGNGQLAVGLL